MNIKTNLFRTARLSFLKLSTLLLIFAFSASITPQNLYAVVATKPAVTANGAEDENFDKKFCEGRDLLDKQEWKKASEKFNEVINQYPDNKSVDAALYWLAFCYKKQREFEKVGATVDRLMKDYPSSSWTSDARILLIEVTQPAKVIYGTTISDGKGGTATVGNFSTNAPDGKGGTATLAGNFSTNAPFKSVQPLTITSMTSASDSYAALNGFYSSSLPTPLDREDEIKLAAFQSLLSADVSKGISAMNDILKSDSKASETLKIEILRSLRSPRNFKVYSSTEYFTTLSTANKIVSPSPALLRDSLIKNYQNNSSVKVRREIIFTLASLKDEQSINALTEIYKSESDLEIKKAIIRGFGSSWANSSGFYTFAAAPNITETRIISGQAVNVPKINNSNKATAQKPEFVKLFEIVEQEKNPELKELALDYLVRFASNNTLFQSPEFLSQMYDEENVESIKRTIIQGLVKINQPFATKKLLEIAKNDQSKNLRIEAIRALGQSKDPEALKYLEEIIK